MEPTQNPKPDSLKEDMEALFEAQFNKDPGSSLEGLPKEPPKPPFSEGSLKPSRTKSSLRKKYEAEVSNIKEHCGDLESIRGQLGLSKRKMAQFLLVDPSAWTRWTAGEAPPHIYRALQWYLLLQEKQPEYKTALWLNSVATPQLSHHEVENLKAEVMAHAESQLQPQPLFQEAAPQNPHLERQLKQAQQESLKLSKHVQWLMLSQLALFLICALSFFF